MSHDPTPTSSHDSTPFLYYLQELIQRELLQQRQRIDSIGIDVGSVTMPFDGGEPSELTFRPTELAQLGALLMTAERQAWESPARNHVVRIFTRICGQIELSVTLVPKAEEARLKGEPGTVSIVSPTYGRRLGVKFAAIADEAKRDGKNVSIRIGMVAGNPEWERILSADDEEDR